MLVSEGFKLNELTDYRVGYFEEEFFKEHIINAYLGCSTSFGPPEFLDILNFLSEEMAVIYCVTNPEDFSHIEDMESFVSDLIDGVDVALSHVYNEMGSDYIEMFARDVHSFLIDNHLFFKETDDISRSFVRYFNEPVMNVW